MSVVSIPPATANAPTIPSSHPSPQAPFFLPNLGFHHRDREATKPFLFFRGKQSNPTPTQTPAHPVIAPSRALHPTHSLTYLLIYLSSNTSFLYSYYSYSPGILFARYRIRSVSYRTRSVLFLSLLFLFFFLYLVFIYLVLIYLICALVGAVQYATLHHTTPQCSRTPVAVRFPVGMNGGRVVDFAACLVGCLVCLFVCVGA